ncbi:hypothetical protein ACIPSA_18520 [Streptomyces sp. NPDC086549]|uniref:hypothetical protein n=1 Tax=Streptomyces sp. NPDC086549 TaxID=3365752 RepID=UPI003830E456
MSEPPAAEQEPDDIQRGVLSPRPTPYAATYLAFRIDDREQERELMRRVSGAVTSAADPAGPLRDTWVSGGLTCHGLKALGVPAASLDTVAWEFLQGMAARASSSWPRCSRPAAIGLAFDDQTAVLEVPAAVLLSGLAAALPIATLRSRRRQGPAPPGTGHGTPPARTHP